MVSCLHGYAAAKTAAISIFKRETRASYLMWKKNRPVLPFIFSVSQIYLITQISQHLKKISTSMHNIEKPF